MDNEKRKRLNWFLSKNTELGVDDTNMLGVRVDVFADGREIKFATHVDFKAKTITRNCIDKNGKITIENDEPKQEKITYETAVLVVS